VWNFVPKCDLTSVKVPIWSIYKRAHAQVKSARGSWEIKRTTAELAKTLSVAQNHFERAMCQCGKNAVEVKNLSLARSAFWSSSMALPQAHMGCMGKSVSPNLQTVNTRLPSQRCKQLQLVSSYLAKKQTVLEQASSSNTAQPVLLNGIATFAKQHQRPAPVAPSSSAPLQPPPLSAEPNSPFRLRVAVDVDEGGSQSGPRLTAALLSFSKLVGVQNVNDQASSMLTATYFSFFVVLGRFLHSLNQFKQEFYGVDFDISDYDVYNFAKVAPATCTLKYCFKLICPYRLSFPQL
jgi:hypothetical protein